MYAVPPHCAVFSQTQPLRVTNITLRLTLAHGGAYCKFFPTAPRCISKAYRTCSHRPQALFAEFAEYFFSSQPICGLYLFFCGLSTQILCLGGF